MDAPTLAGVFRPVLDAAATALPDGGRNGTTLTRLADCRFVGQGYEVTVSASRDDPAALAAAFRDAHRARYGHTHAEQPIELVNVRVAVERTVPLPRLALRAGVGTPTPGSRDIATRDGTAVRAAVWPLGELPAGLELEGPAVLAGADATALIEPGWRGRVHASGAVVMERR
jgi:N-methylhydantoinase A